MNRIWRQLAIATNWPVLVAATVLSTVGIISIWADSAPDGPKQLLFFFIALGCMAAVQAVNYMNLGRWAWALYGLSLLLIIYTLVGAYVSLPFIHQINGAHCWISFPGFSFEPSELMKVSFVMLMARYLRFRSNYRSLPGLLPPFALALAPMLLILKQPDLGVAALFIPTLLVMLFVAGAKIRHLAAIVAMGIAVVPFIWLSGQEGVPIFNHLPSLVHSYQRGRVKDLFHSDPKTLRAGGFQQERALEAAGSGGLTGKGLGVIPIGKSVPEVHNDMIFAIIGEQFGLVGSIAVIAAYIVLFAAGIEIAAATREPFGRLLAVGIVSFLAAQAFLNLMVVLRLFPVTGVTLPFVSYGGSSLVASYIAAGLLLNIGQTRQLVIARDSFEFD
ncbi:MAG: FtsW/RodA/SpoVE family cell cycle protein [Planctomycetota bacterium]|nr:FtsW/RodA/SpoVE family cell cycle protein [Planctomycetota bacterium]